MKIKIKATNLELTSAIREYIEMRIDGLAKFVKRLEENGSEVLARVEIARTSRHHEKGDVYYAEVNLDLTHNIARASREGSDIRATIDEVHDILKRMLVKKKEKPRTLSR